MINYYHIMESLASNLARIMAEKGLNQVQLAKISGVKQPLLSSYLNESRHARQPSMKTMRKLADALNCSVDELLGTERPSPKPAPAPSAESEEIRRLIEEAPAHLRKQIIDILRRLIETRKQIENHDKDIAKREDDK